VRSIRETVWAHASGGSPLGTTPPTAMATAMAMATTGTDEARRSVVRHEVPSPHSGAVGFSSRSASVGRPCLAASRSIRNKICAVRKASPGAVWRS